MNIRKRKQRVQKGIEYYSEQDNLRLFSEFDSTKERFQLSNHVFSELKTQKNLNNVLNEENDEQESSKKTLKFQSLRSKIQAKLAYVYDSENLYLINPEVTLEPSYRFEDNTFGKIDEYQDLDSKSQKSKNSLKSNLTNNSLLLQVNKNHQKNILKSNFYAKKDQSKIILAKIQDFRKKQVEEIEKVQNEKATKLNENYPPLTMIGASPIDVKHPLRRESFLLSLGQNNITAKKVNARNYSSKRRDSRIKDSPKRNHEPIKEKNLEDPKVKAGQFYRFADVISPNYRIQMLKEIEALKKTPIKPISKL